MLLLTLLACGIDLPLQPTGDWATLPLTAVDAGDGQTLAEFVDTELTRSLDVDWSFLNLAGLPADTIGVTPRVVDTAGSCEIDDAGLPTSCSFWAEVAVTSGSGWWEYSSRNLVSWAPGELRYSFSDDVPLDADQVALIAAGVADDGFTFSGDSVSFCVWRGADGSGVGLPKGAQRNVVQIDGTEGTTPEGAVLAADDTVDAD